MIVVDNVENNNLIDVNTAKVDLIIPTYCKNEKDVEMLKRALSSVSMQINKENIYITVMDDGSVVSLDDCIKSFESLINIHVIRQENQGVSIARDNGLWNTHNPFVMFLDSDDVLLTPFSVSTLLYPYSQKDNWLISVANFRQQIDDTSTYKEVEFNTTWLHGKMWRRKFIEDNNIHFPTEFKHNEDVAFNLTAFAIATMSNIAYVKEDVYYWMTNNQSLTRNENGDYAKNGMSDFVKAFLAYEKEVTNRGLQDTPFCKEQSFKNLFMLYWYNVQMSFENSAEELNRYNDLCGQYLKLMGIKSLKQLQELVNTKEFLKSYITSTKACGFLTDEYVPMITIFDWIYQIYPKKNK